ncbi:MAG: alpha/beta hydrolase [Gemmatimonadota bacterium]
MILHHESIISDSAPGQYFYILHGIFGAGRNWASIARRLVKARPDWGARLIDLRQHGASQGFAGPHTLEAAAIDLVELARELGELPVGILGHSFGGKVALQYARDHGELLQQLWIIDSTPDARPPSGSAWGMLEIVRSLPDRFAARQDLVTALSEKGLALNTAQWMATNLEHIADGYRWRFDLDAMEELLLSFFQTDLFDVIENPPGEVQLHIVKATQSSVLSPESIARIRAIALKNERVHYHEVEGGHWLNADNPDALQQLLALNL